MANIGLEISPIDILDMLDSAQSPNAALAFI